MYNLLDYKVWFATLPLSNNIKMTLINNLKSEEEVFENRKTLKKINDKYLKVLDTPLDNEICYKVKGEIDRGVYKIVTYLDEEYPRDLKEIKDSPYVLFFKGELEEINKRKTLAIVGSRNCTSYGKEVTKYICNELGKKQINIVSGGALGIDTIAHESCIKKDYYNVAILGCGINKCYPAYNKQLYKSLESCGAVVSEFLPNTPPFHYNFPRRNRIISGLAKGIIVIEAGEKSGSLITCSLALEQGKDVVAIPGSIFSPQSKGCNKLIKDGAILFTNIDDMLYNFSIDSKEEKTKKCNGLKGQILKLLDEKIMHIDEIIRVVNIDTSILHELLCELQFENEITNIYGNYYAKIL